MRSVVGSGAVRNNHEPTGVGRHVVENQASRIPHLLVSVRSAEEAERAIAGGAEILDIKEPSSGSLGMGRLSDISAIAGLSDVTCGRIPLSVALGELDDWSTESEIPQLPVGVRFAKMGLSQSANDKGWISRWMNVRRSFNQQSGSTISWVAVAYADAAVAYAADIEQVLDAAMQTECEGLLIDTWKKDGRRLLDHVDAVRLEQVAERCHRSGLFLALAGSLNGSSLSQIQNIAADIVAIRSAACRAGDRTSELDSNQVTVFHEELQRIFSQTPANRNC